MVSVAVVPAICWSVETSRSIGSVFILASTFGTHAVQLFGVGVLQGVLIERPRQPPAHVDVLRGLHE